MTGWIAALLNVIGLVLLGAKIRIGWLFGIAAECLWVVRAESLSMYDLTAISVLYICVAAFNWWRWREDADH